MLTCENPSFKWTDLRGYPRYDARWELESEFGGVVPDEVIGKLADKLEQESWQWAPVAKWDDYDHELYEAISANSVPAITLENELLSVGALVAQPVDDKNRQVLNRLLFANLFSILEAYLCDTFIKHVFGNPEFFRRHVEAFPAYKQQKLPLGEIFKIQEDLERIVRANLLELVWHRFSTVFQMYRSAFGIQMDFLQELERAVQKRHAIVHRNGKDKDGNALQIDEAEIKDLILKIRSLSEKIEIFFASGAKP